MAAVSYNIGADVILERALGTTALDLRAAFVRATGGATDIAAIINKDLDFVSTIDALTGLDISTQRVTITGETSTEDDTNDRANLDFNDVVFSPVAGQSAWGWIVYDEGGGTDATRALVFGQSFAAAQPVDGGLTVTVNDLLRFVTATV